MADDKIISTVELQGAEQVQKDFKATGDAGQQAFERMGDAAEKTNFDKFSDNVKSIAQAAQELADRARQVSSSLEKQAEATDKVAESSGKAAKSTSTFASNLSSLAVRAGAVVVGLLGLKVSIDSIKTSLEGVREVGTLADKADLGLGNFQKLQFIFESLGLSTSEARAKIQEFVDEADKAAEKVEKLSAGAQKLIENTRQAGVSFSNTAGGMEAFRNQVAASAQSAANGRIPIEKLSELMKKFAGETDPQKLVEFTNELAKLGQQGQGIAQIFGALGNQGGFGKVINIPQIVEATNKVTNLKEAYAAFIKDVSPNNFARLVNFLQEITDEEERATKAAELLGDEMGGNLIRMLKELEKSGGGATNPIKELLADFIKLRAESAKNAQILSENFNRAMVRLATATRAGKEELALLFAPALTAGANAFATALRLNKGILGELVAFISGTATGVIQGFIDLISGKDTPQKEGSWMEAARKAVVDFGKAVGTVFNNIILPAVTGAIKFFGELGEIVSKALGFNVSGSEIGLVAIITALLGPVNALIGAFSILFGLNEKGFQKVAEFFAKFGIDLNKIRADVIKFKDDFVAAFQGKEVDNEWAKDLVEIIKALPAAILAAVGAFFVLRRALVPIAGLISAVFGKKVSAEGLILTSIIGQLSGAFDVMKGTLVLVAAGFAALGSAFFAVYRAGLLIGQILTGMIFLFGPLNAAIIVFAGLALLVATNWERTKEILKSFGIDVDKLTASIDAFFAKNFGGFKPFEEIGKLLSKISTDWKEFKKNVEEFSIVDAVRKDLEKSLGKGNIFEQFFKDIDDFKKTLETEGIGAAILQDLNKTFGKPLRDAFQPLFDFFKPGGELDQAVVGMFNSAIAAIGRGLDAIIEAARQKIISLLNLIPGVNIKTEATPNDRVRQGFEDTNKAVDVTNEKVQQLQKRLDELRGPKQIEIDVEAARQEVTELEEELRVLNTELSGARRQKPASSGGVKDIFTEQFGDPAVFTEKIAEAEKKTKELAGEVKIGGMAWDQIVQNLKPYVQGVNEGSLKTEEVVKSLARTPAQYDQIMQSIRPYVQGIGTVKQQVDLIPDALKLAENEITQSVTSAQALAAEWQKILDRIKASKEAAGQIPAAKPAAPATPDEEEEEDEDASLKGGPSTDMSASRRQGGSALLDQAKTVTAQISEVLKTTQQDIAAFASTALESIQTSIQSASDAVKTSIESTKSVVDSLGQSFSLLAEKIVAMSQQVPSALAAAFVVDPIFAFQAAIDSMTASVSASLDALIAKFNAMAEAARQAAAAAASASGGGGSSPSGFASGGPIGGKPGVDKNLILASADEFMIRARAVKKYGLGLLHAINEGRFKIPRFDSGGLIGMGQSLAIPSSSFSGGSGSGANAAGWEFVKLEAPGFGIIPVMMKSDTLRDVRDAGVRNRQNSISKTTR